MRKKPLRNKSKQKISTIQNKIWEECKRIIRKRHGNVCYTCSQTGLTGSNWQTGHLWPKAALGAYMKYDLRVLRPQCYNCNINRGGMGADFYRKMIAEIGLEKMNEMEHDRQRLVKAYDFYTGLLVTYKSL